MRSIAALIFLFVAIALALYARWVFDPKRKENDVVAAVARPVLGFCAAIGCPFCLAASAAIYFM